MNDNFAQQVEFKINEREVGTVVVNGVAQQSRRVQYISMICPKCGSELMSFQEGVHLVEIYKELAKISPVENLQKYCHNCGIKLMCDKSIVGEQSYEEK